jgi:ubiquinone/menaquinone biosynthesis C-methylase UbiE
VKLLLQSVAGSAPRRVLEIGSTGGLAELVAREFDAEVFGAGAFEELPFPAHSFDCVVAAADLPDAVLRELRRVLDEDGKLIAVAPQSQWFLLRHFTVVETRQDVFICTP